MFFRFLKNLNVNHKKFNEKVVQAKPWFIFRWEVAIIIFLTLLAAIMNILPVWAGKNGVTIYFPNGDKYTPNLLRDNIVYSTISISLTILAAIFIGIYTEIGQYAGKYSSALFALVPSIVWLLSDRADNHIEHLTKTANMLGEIILYAILAITALFIVSWVITKVVIRMTTSNYVKIKYEAINNIVNRICIVLINIGILMMLGYSLVNFGIFTLHLGDVSPEQQEAIQKATGANPGPYNLHSENFTTYIAIIAIAFAVLMVAIGLSNIFMSDKPVAIDEDNMRTREISVSEVNKLAATNHEENLVIKSLDDMHKKWGGEDG